MTLLQEEGLLNNPMVMMALMLIAIPIVIVCVWNVILDVRKQEGKRVDDRLMGKTPKKGQKSEEEIRKSLIKKSALSQAGGGFAKSFGKFTPIENLQKACFQADLDWDAARLVFRLGATALAVMSILFVAGIRDWRPPVLGLMIFFFPIFYVYYMKKRRINALVEQLPEVFDALVNALRAGQSLPAAIGVVAEQLPEPSRTEFGIVYHEQNLGIRLEDALGNMRTRLNQMDVSFFVTAVQIQKAAGGDLAEVLDNIGSIIRSRIKLFGQVQVLTAEGRMSGVVLLGLPPGMLLVMMMINPEYASQLTDKTIGHYMLGASAVAEILGWLMIKKIVDIQV